MELSLRLKVSVGHIHNLLVADGIRKLLSKMCANRWSACETNLRLLEEYGDVFLNNIVTVDETSLSLYVPKSKRE